MLFLSELHEVIVNNEEKLQNLLNKLKREKFFAFSINIDNSDFLSFNLIGFSLVLNLEEVFYFPVSVHLHEKERKYKEIDSIKLLKMFMEDPNLTKIGYDVKFSYMLLKSLGISIIGKIYDISVESYVLKTQGLHDFKNLTKKFLNFTSVEINTFFNKKNNIFVIKNSSLSEIIFYSSRNASIVFRIHQKIWPMIKNHSELVKILEEIDLPLVSVLSNIEYCGVLIDKKFFSSYSSDLNLQIKKIEKKIFDKTKEPFNISSIKKIQNILFNQNKFPIIKKTNKGFPSTEKKVLKKLDIKNNDLPKLILEYRNLLKLKTTYIDKLLKMIHPKSKRLHTCYQQTNTKTGRLSSKNPNLQNIPVHDFNGKIRKAFIVPKNMLMLVADYSQIELRIMAHVSKDPGLLDAFYSGKDIHKITGSEIFGIPLNMVSEKQRKFAKTINFGLINGMSAFGLSQQLSISTSEAKKYIDSYFKKYPGILSYIYSVKKQVNNFGFIKTLCGRRIEFPNIFSKNLLKRKSAERSAINAPLQGTAADIIKKAMILIDSWINKENLLLVRMIMQIHDELVFEIQNREIRKIQYEIKKIMEECFQLEIPLKVNISIGKNWNKPHI